MKAVKAKTKPRSKFQRCHPRQRGFEE